MWLILKQRKELIVNFYKVHRDECVAYTVKHFWLEGWKWEKSLKIDTSKEKVIGECCDEKNGVSQAKLVQKFSVHKSKREGCKSY